MSEANRVTYPVSNPQQTILYQVIYSPNKRLIQIPMYITVNQTLDLDMLRRAVEIEYERNDSLRVRFCSEDGKTRQYFLDKVDTNIRIMDFSGKTKEQQDREIEKDSLEVQDWENGDLARFILFRTYNGCTGIYAHISHLVMDATALVILFQDIFNVYFALRDGTELPRPLDRFEDALKRDLEHDNNAAQMKKDADFFSETFKAYGEPTYAGVSGSGPLKRQRIMFRNRNQQYIVPTYAMSDKLGTETLVLSADEAESLYKFCEANRIHFNAFLQLAIRSYCSKVNGGQENIAFTTICNRRSSRADKNSCGCRMNTFLLYTHVTDDMTVTDVLKDLGRLNMSAMRHNNYPILYALGSMYKIYRTQKKGTYTSFMLTYLPFKPDIPEGWVLDYKWFDPGNAMPIYIFVLPELSGTGLAFNYEYRKAHIKKKHIEKMHDYVIRFMKAVAENPDAKMKELLAL